MPDQTVIFCVGAAKSGTSWLWDYLYGHPDVYFPTVKELHYFDVVEHGNRPWFHRDLAKLVETMEAEKAAGEIREFREKRLVDSKRWLAAFDGKTRDDAAYLDFIGHGSSEARVVGDFTPSYALLEEGTLADMAAIAKDVRFIFLMREPVARLWSNVRMDAGKKASEADLDALLGKVLEGEENNIGPRCNYRRTLNRLARVVPEDRLFLAFYEDLFTDETIARLNDFLGIRQHPADFEKVVWAGRPAPLPEGRLEAMVAYLRPQYNFVERRMGALPTQWQETLRAVS